MNSFAELLAALGPLEPIAERLGLTVAAVSNMKTRNSILAKHWPALIRMAEEAGIPGLTYEQLVDFSASPTSRVSRIASASPPTMPGGAAPENTNQAEVLG